MCLLAATLLELSSVSFSTFFGWAITKGPLRLSQSDREHKPPFLDSAVSSRLCCQYTWTACGNTAQVWNDTAQSWMGVWLICQAWEQMCEQEGSVGSGIDYIVKWAEVTAFSQCSILATGLLLSEEALTNKSSHHLGTSDFLKPLLSGFWCRKQVVFTGWLTNVLSSGRQRWCGSFSFF